MTGQHEPLRKPEVKSSASHAVNKKWKYTCVYFQ